MSHWNPYQPSKSLPWDRTRVVHLHRRVVFGACWNEIERDLKDTVDTAVTRVLGGTCRMSVLPPEFESLSRAIGDSAIATGNPDRLKAWWLYRCLFSPHPLQERMALLWHGHFATSNVKILNLTAMKAQNEKFRRYGLSTFGELLGAMSHDAALLEWLDAPSNHAGRPNENFAREMMELFTLGVGNYTESDVAEAARAFTGWTVIQSEFRVNNAHHDREPKTVLNQTGNWSGDDIVSILLQQPSCARRIAWRLVSEFFGENIVSDAALTELANGLREHNLDLRWGVESILRSELFFSDANIQSRIADPVSFLLMPLRAIECWQAPPRTLELASWLDKIGQQLFYPPNVGGWNGGRAWLSTRTMIARTNYLTALANGNLANPKRPLTMPSGLESIPDPFERLMALGELLCGGRNAAALNQMVENAGRSDTSNELSPCLRDFLAQPGAQLN